MATEIVPPASRPTTATTSTTHVTGNDVNLHGDADNENVAKMDMFGRAAIMFTGPDGLRDHRRKILSNQQYVGGNTASRECTGSLDYLMRCPKTTPFTKAKHNCIGEIGWEVQHLKLDTRLLRLQNQTPKMNFGTYW